MRRTTSCSAFPSCLIPWMLLMFWMGLEEGPQLRQRVLWARGKGDQEARSPLPGVGSPPLEKPGLLLGSGA